MLFAVLFALNNNHVYDYIIININTNGVMAMRSIPPVLPT